MSLSTWLNMLGQLLSFTVGSLDGASITLGGALAICVGCLGIGAVISVIARIGSR